MNYNNMQVVNPLPPVARFPRNLEQNSHYATMNGLLKIHPLVKDYGVSEPLMHMSSAAHTVWSMLTSGRENYRRQLYNRIRRKMPETASNRS